MAPSKTAAKQNSGTKGTSLRILRLSLKMDMFSWGEKQFNKQLKKKKKILRRMEAKAVEETAETRYVREEAAEMAEAVEEKEAELELLRMLHNQLFVDMLHITGAEERLMEILIS